MVVGFGYGGADRAQIAETLDRPGVEQWGIAALGNATIDGVTVPTVVARSGFGEMPLPLVAGSLPVADDELALGTHRRSARARYRGLGDGHVRLQRGRRNGQWLGRDAPGRFVSCRSSVARNRHAPVGGLLDAIVAVAEETAGVPAGSFADGSESFVVIDLRDDVDAALFLADIGDGLGKWSLDAYFPFLHAEAVRPAQIVDVAAMRSAPVLPAAFISAAMGVGLALAVGPCRAQSAP